MKTPKYPKLQKWYAEWEAYKLKKQEEERVLTEKVRQGQASEEDIVKLEKVKKEAKVTVGATNFTELYKQILTGNIDKLKLESFVNKVNLPYNSLVIIDDSGSMRGAPFNFASFIAAVCLCKNPDDDGRNLLGFFNSYTHWHCYVDKQADSLPNWLIKAKVSDIRPTPFVDPKKSFYDNYIFIRNFCNAVFNGGGTQISKIPDDLYVAGRKHPELLDYIKAYPVWTIISDGEWNCFPSPKKSIEAFMDKCYRNFGFKPFIIAIDIHDGNLDVNHFEGIENLIYIPSNPAQIEMFLTNFKNMDTIDVYTPLQSLYRSNRYDIVRANVL